MLTFIQRVQRLQSLSRADWQTVADSVLTIASVWLSLRVAPGRTIRMALQENRTAHREREAEPGAAILCGRTAAVFQYVALAHPARPKCLVRSIALQRILRKAGIDATLKVRMTRTIDSVAGHAWLEVEGVVINDSPLLAREPHLVL